MTARTKTDRIDDLLDSARKQVLEMRRSMQDREAQLVKELADLRAALAALADVEEEEEVKPEGTAKFYTVRVSRRFIGYRDILVRAESEEEAEEADFSCYLDEYTVDEWEEDGDPEVESANEEKHGEYSEGDEVIDTCPEAKDYGYEGED